MKFIDHFLFPAHLSAVSPSVPCFEGSSGLVGFWWWKHMYSNTLQQTTLPKTDSLSLKNGTWKTPYFPLRRGINLIFLFQVATINVPFGSQHHTPLWKYHCNLPMFMGPHFKANQFSAEVFSASPSPRCCTNPRWWWQAIKKTCSYIWSKDPNPEKQIGNIFSTPCSNNMVEKWNWLISKWYVYSTRRNIHHFRSNGKTNNNMSYP